MTTNIEYTIPLDSIGHIKIIERKTALKLHLGVPIIKIYIANNASTLFKYDGAEYRVLTNDEADKLWNEMLYEQMEEFLKYRTDLSIKFYFDDEKWLNKARQDGRAYTISRCDGLEYVEKVNGTEYYIYRIN